MLDTSTVCPHSVESVTIRQLCWYKVPDSMHFYRFLYRIRSLYFTVAKRIVLMNQIDFNSKSKQTAELYLPLSF